MLFAGLEVRIGKNCARAQDQGHSFSQYGPTFIFFSLENYFIRNIFVDFFTAVVSHRARAFGVSVK